jgi:hypothetical protein
MNLSHPNRTLGLRTTASCGDKQALVQRSEVELTVAAVGKCGQVAGGILSEGECMVAAGQTALGVAEDGVDPLELGQFFWLSSRDDGGLMHAPGLCGRAETGQAIGTSGAARGEVGAGPHGNRLEGETGHWRELGAQRMALIAERDGGHKRDFVLGATTDLPAATLAAEAGIIDMDLASENIGLFACSHCVHQFVMNEPRRWITHAQVSFECERRQSGLGLANQVDGKEPDRQPKLCTLENGTGNQRGLMTAGVALEHLAVRTAQNTMRRRTAARTAKALWPASPLKRRFAPGLGTILFKKFWHRQAWLELNSIHWHGARLWAGSVRAYSICYLRALGARMADVHF